MPRAVPRLFDASHVRPLPSGVEWGEYVYKEYNERQGYVKIMVRNSLSMLVPAISSFCNTIQLSALNQVLHPLYGWPAMSENMLELLNARRIIAILQQRKRIPHFDSTRTFDFYQLHEYLRERKKRESSFNDFRCKSGGYFSGMRFTSEFLFWKLQIVNL